MEYNFFYVLILIFVASLRFLQYSHSILDLNLVLIGKKKTLKRGWGSQLETILFSGEKTSHRVSVALSENSGCKLGCAGGVSLYQKT